MRILLYNTWRVVGSKGGTEKVLCGMANAFVNRNHSVLVMIGEDKKGMPFFHLDEKVEFVNVGGIGILNKIIVYLKSMLSLRKENRYFKGYKYRSSFIQKKITPVIEKFKPDVIISFTRDGAFYLKYDFSLDCPVILMFHLIAEKILDRKEFYSIFESCECIQTILERDLKVTVDTIIPKKIVSIANAVSQFEDRANVTNKKIISIGRISREDKRQHIVIEAMNILKEGFPDWCVEFWGETEFDKKYYNELISLIRKYNLKNVKFCGTTSDVKNVLKSSSIFAISSAHESFGLALTEAMSLGIPAVGFKKCHSVNEIIIHGENGILCDDSIEAYASGLAELMSNEEKRKIYGRRAKEDMKRYEPAIIWKKWEDLIKEVVSDYKGKS